MTDNTWDAEHYPAPQPSATFAGERMPLVAHPAAVTDAMTDLWKVEDMLALVAVERVDPFAGIPNARDEDNRPF